VPEPLGENNKKLRALDIRRTRLIKKAHTKLAIAKIDVTFRRRQHEISKVDRTVFSDVGVASENGK